MKTILTLLLLSGLTAHADTFGDWQYHVHNNEATISGYTGSGGAVTVPSQLNGIPVKGVGLSYPPDIVGPVFATWTEPNTSITSISLPDGISSLGDYAFAYCRNLTSINIPDSVTRIADVVFAETGLTSIVIPDSVVSMGSSVFSRCPLTSITLPHRFAAQIGDLQLRGQLATDTLISALANNDAFVAAVANKILAGSNNYGLATQGGISNIISTLATKTELTNALTQSRTDGINSVLSNPNLWTLYTTNQIKNMAIGDLVLSKQVNGQFVLNYDIEQSEDLQTWTPYLSYALPMTNLPTDKAFVRIKAK